MPISLVLEKFFFFPAVKVQFFIIHTILSSQYMVFNNKVPINILQPLPVDEPPHNYVIRNLISSNKFLQLPPSFVNMFQKLWTSILQILPEREKNAHKYIFKSSYS